MSLISDVDKDLKILYDTLESNYDPEDVLCILTADHGVNFIDGDNYLLSTARTNVPVFARSQNLSSGVDSSLVQNIDIFPSLLKLSRLNFPDTPLDGKQWPSLGGECRDYLISEVLYEPDYRLVITNLNCIYRLHCGFANSHINLNTKTVHISDNFGKDFFEYTDSLTHDGIIHEFDLIAMRHISSTQYNLTNSVI